MILKHILKWCCFLLIALSLSHQVQATEKKDTYRGLRLGLDVTGPGQYFLNGGKLHTHFSIDVPVNKFWFPVAEFGMSKMSYTSDNIDYSLNGSYYLLGIDHNLIGKKNTEKIERDMAFIGYRLAYGTFGYQSPSFLIENPYWGNYSGSIPSQSHHVLWAELTGGVKTEIFRNFFLGWNIRMKIKLAGKMDENNKPALIPGFGNPNKRVNPGVTFSVFYLIPF